MAVVGITSTRDVGGACRYATTEQKKNLEDGTERVLYGSGVNCDFENGAQQMKQTLRAHGKDGFGKDARKYVQAYRIFQSFGDELDPDNPEDVKKAHELGIKLAETLYPGYQALVVTQADGKGNKLHNHIIVCAVDPATGKSLRGESRSHFHIAKVSDELCREANLPVIERTREDRMSKGEYHKTMRGEYTFMGDLRSRIRNSLVGSNVYDEESFIKEMSARNVDVNITNKGGISYAFDGEDGNHYAVTGGKCGKNYKLKSLKKVFAKNGADRELMLQAMREDEAQRQRIERERLERARLKALKAKEKEEKEPESDEENLVAIPDQVVDTNTPKTRNMDDWARELAQEYYQNKKAFQNKLPRQKSRQKSDKEFE